MKGAPTGSGHDSTVRPVGMVGWLVGWLPSATFRGTGEVDLILVDVMSHGHVDEDLRYVGEGW